AGVGIDTIEHEQARAGLGDAPVTHGAGDFRVGAGEPVGDVEDARGALQVDGAAEVRGVDRTGAGHVAAEEERGGVETAAGGGDAARADTDRRAAGDGRGPEVQRLRGEGRAAGDGGVVVVGPEFERPVDGKR